MDLLNGSCSLASKSMPNSYKCNCSPTKTSLVDSRFNYLNSGVPHLIMFYNHGDWLLFPDSVTEILIEGFRNEKPSIKFSIGSEPLLFDYVSMAVINVRTRKQRSVAWIDEADKCYFPAHFGDDYDGSNEWDFESLENRPVQMGLERATFSPSEVIKQVVGEIGASTPQRPPNAANPLRMNLDPLERGSESFLYVQKLFLSGMGPFAKPGNIIHIHRYAPKDNSGLRRKETFERIINLTEEERGNANVKHAWFGGRKEDIIGTLVYGFGNYAKPTDGALGTGYYLMPEQRSFASVNLCDVDGDGVQCMILCRVVLGNIEQLRPGSMQYFPSSADYESGVDNLSSPKCYVVWSTHMTAFLHPEYFISFKLDFNAREYLLGLKGIRFHPTTTQVVSDSSSHHIVNPDPKKQFSNMFTLLLEAIQDDVCPFAMELLSCHHQEFVSAVINREDLIKKSRMIIGDQLLRTVATRIRNHVAGWKQRSISSWSAQLSFKHLSRTHVGTKIYNHFLPEKASKRYGRPLSFSLATSSDVTLDIVER